MSKNILIYFSAGHGGNGSTPGKRTPDGEYEWNFNDVVAKAFEDRIKTYKGIKAVRTDDRSGKTDVPLSTRTNAANRAGADLYLDFHHNAFKGVWGDHTGIETYYHKGSTEGKKLAAIIQKINVEVYGLRDRGLNTKNLHITRETNMPAVLSEGGFMDSTIDIKKLRDDNILKESGRRIADAVGEYFNLNKSTTSKPKERSPISADKIVSKGIETLAREVIAGKHGTGDARKKSLGALYSQVQARVNEKLSPSKKTKPKVKSIDQLAREVIDGKHGTGDARKKSLGALYSKVQKRVNTILGSGGTPSGKDIIRKLADEVELGLHGNGEDRKKSLGANYTAVQNEINRRYSK